METLAKKFPEVYEMAPGIKHSQRQRVPIIKNILILNRQSMRSLWPESIDQDVRINQSADSTDQQSFSRNMLFQTACFEAFD